MKSVEQRVSVRPVGGEKPSQKNRNHIQTVVNALDILDYMQSCDGEVGVTEVGQALKMHKSNVSRLLSTMESKGYVNKDMESGKYTLGTRIVELAKTRLDQMDLRSHARPFLEELVKKTNETAHLAILDQGRIIYIDKVDTPQTLMMRSKIGYRAFPHCTALGKAILAALPEGEMNALLQEQSMPRLTPNTITDAVALRDHLRRVKDQGFAIDEEENEEGIRCAAAPIRDYTGHVVGAISISAPIMRVSRQQVQEIGILVRDTCCRLSATLGYVNKRQNRDTNEESHKKAGPSIS